MQDITSRWGVLALAALHDGPHRFGELRRRVDGVSERMLAQTLQRLERDGLVTRTVLTQIPPAVEYALTDLGSDAAAALVQLIGVVERRIDEVVTARADYDRRTDRAGVTPS
ncbi:winged helix-turn-helix transcriptional regulator [Rhodococcoides corynebacterioides]|uniref:Helix-turn-helix transcriptional regulator n=1 Tax=Rhodococcoides corynebacterioides TaxID=53972 RepID=A0ABS7P887_9NOCA|nr:helix-turn-helix domain-containing protein [Rhodococcus corynebacterioides]MBY6368603.1 helix-turn-helix transcriptional regulator [Rhodococcus corynebacterioides]MBY6409580.1 helix-turn-helix transcriptional regulator [Rhodococcus corynebacterioides]